MFHTINYRLTKLCNNVSQQLLHFNGISRTKLWVHSQTECNNVNTVIQSNNRLLKVAIVGAPNVGKSTLINQILQRKVFPISKKVHTTRCRAKAVYNEGKVQLVFLDTPGLVTVTESQKYKLEAEFVTGGENAIIEADLIGVVHDLSNRYTRKSLDAKVLRLLHLYRNKDSILIMNKVDTVKSKRKLLDITDVLTAGKLRNSTIDSIDSSNDLSEKSIQDRIKNQHHWEQFSQVFMVSALLGTGVSELKAYLLNSAKYGDWLFPENSFTDQSPEVLITETVRSKLLEHLPQEIPYKLNVELEYLDAEQKDIIMAVVNVGCDTSRIEGLVRGSGGHRIKTIATEAEQSLSDAFLTSVHLRVVVCSKQL
ncbi:hypothetical protein O3M35_010973 [Rhynocoris fuscipes]|uniref:GTPase Era, mitochondrial n=1 Tax=Rhynocoris fuscipes TaxID=488301 RepID=A0AAW1D110_9HEMI